MAANDEEGLTLIELLVVIVIVSLLAAIAIPLFLAQRERGWNAQSESALRNAATAMQAAAIGDDTYAGITIPDLVANEGLKFSNNVTLAVESADEKGFCLSAYHQSSLVTTYWDSSIGRPSAADCSGNYV